MMNKIIEQMCLEETEGGLKHLIAPHDQPWTVDAAYSSALEQMTQHLMKRFMERASFFAANRNKDIPKKSRKATSMKQDDFNYAWESLEQDTMN